MLHATTNLPVPPAIAEVVAKEAHFIFLHFRDNVTSDLIQQRLRLFINIKCCTANLHTASLNPLILYPGG